LVEGTGRKFGQARKKKIQKEINSYVGRADDSGERAHSRKEALRFRGKIEEEERKPL